MLKSLTKENFWNELQEKYPDLMKEFCEFIDAYKEKVGWAHLLGRAVKYHDLPIEMQIGIFIQFTLERGSINNFLCDLYVMNMEQFAVGIKDWFRIEHEDRIADLPDGITIPNKATIKGHDEELE